MRVVVQAFYNLGMLAFGFAFALIMDYGYVKMGAANNPDSLFRRTQWMAWLFPACVFGVNWLLLRGHLLSRRLAVCIALAALLFVVEIALLSTIGTAVHFSIGGTE
jgi:hypothetical protein